MSNALDMFHVGFTVRDIRATMAELSSVLGCSWSDISETTLALQHGDEAINPEMKFAFSLGSEGGQLELIEQVPGTVWELPHSVDVQFNHLGYWTHALADDSSSLSERGMPMLCTYTAETPVDGFAYHRLPSGLMVELVDTGNKPVFDAWFAGGDFSGEPESS